MAVKSSRTAAVANALNYDALDRDTYIRGAPHIRHPRLRNLYVQLLAEVFECAAGYSARPTLLDLGAGEGSVTFPMLCSGARVDAVDISQNRLESLARMCAGHESNLRLCCQDAGTFLNECGDSYDVIVASAFLHHVPDYLELVEMALGRLAPHGQFFLFQELIRYDTLPLPARLFSETAYLGWRLFQGDLLHGFQRRARRSFGKFGDAVEDNVDYHLVRNGMDEIAIRGLLERRGFECRVIRYFSTQSSLFQWVGSSLGIENTFALVGRKRT